MDFASSWKAPLWASAVALAATTAFVDPASAQNTCTYPERPVTVVVGFSPGGGTDAIARLLSHELSSSLTGQPFNVVNKPGGAQVPAMKYVMEADKDGYTLEFFSTGSAVMATLLRDQGFTWADEFQPIANLGVSTSVLAVNDKAPVKTAQEMIDWIKDSHAGGSKLRYGHAGRGSSSHISIAAWLEANGLYQMVQDVPFEGSGPSQAALIGGQVDFGGMNIANVDESPELRGIGTLSDERDPAIDYIPTMKEQGVPYVNMDGPLLLAAAKGVPDEVLDCLEAAVKEVSERPSFQEAMKKAGFAVIYRDSETTTAMVNELIDGWKKAVDSVMSSAQSN